jgi:MOSC domain-containing protein YiiM
VELEVWRDCAPCEVMDQVFGDGAKAALKRRAGVSAQILRGGVVHVGDPVTIAAHE